MADCDSDSDSEADNKEDEQEQASSEEESTREASIRLYGSASPKKDEPDSPKWGSTPAKTPTWGNNPFPVNNNEKEWAEEWREKGRASDRRSRDEEIARGGSPPPKLDADDFFSEGSSRKRTKPVYRNKCDITYKVEER